MAIFNNQLTNIPKNVRWLASASHLPAHWDQIFVWNSKRHQCSWNSLSKVPFCSSEQLNIRSNIISTLQMRLPQLGELKWLVRGKISLAFHCTKFTLSLKNLFVNTYYVPSAVPDTLGQRAGQVLWMQCSQRPDWEQRVLMTSQRRLWKLQVPHLGSLASTTDVYTHVHKHAGVRIHTDIPTYTCTLTCVRAHWHTHTTTPAHPQLMAPLFS